MSDSSIRAEQAGCTHERQPDYGSGGLTAKEWTQLADSGATTYMVGEPAHWTGVFADRSAAEALADEHGGTFIEWTGRTGHIVTTADCDLELEA